MSITLRDYQSKAIQDLRQSIAAGSRSPLLVIPTGGGKTTVFGELSRLSVSRGKRVVVIAHRAELINQAAERLRLMGLEPGVIAAGKPSNPTSPVQVASVQTLIRRLEGMPAPDLLVIDEAHHAPAGSWAAVREAWSSAVCLGVTATPCRLDGRGMGDAFDSLILGPSVRDLTARGFLVPADVYSPSVPDLAGVRTRGGDYSKEDLEAALARSSVVGDAVRSFREHVPDDGTAIAFCSSVAHATATVDAFNSAGIRAAVLTGSDRPEVREATMAGLAAGFIRVVASVDVLGEGVDVPSIRAAILLRPTKSLALYLQQVGRALRPAPGKDRAVILDHSGNARLRHGLPIEDRTWSLDGAPRRNDRQTATDGTPLAIRTCLTCYAVHEAAPICPHCDTEHPRDERVPLSRAGELKRLEEAERLAELRRNEERGEKTLADWLKIAKERGYAPGWAHTRHKLRQKGRRAA